MIFYFRCLTLLLLVPAGSVLLAQAEVPVPPLERRVTDLTGTLSSSQLEQIDARLKDLESRKGSQLAVLVLPSTKPETIEQYSMRVAEAWKLGRKGVDDGALLTVALSDRKMRIEVGYGLEGSLTDATCKRIIAEIITPYFKEKDYNGGINAGVDAIIKVIDGEELPPPPEGSAAGLSLGFKDALFNIFLAAGVITGLILRSFLGRFLGAGIMGLAVFLIALLVLAFSQAAILGLIVFAIVLFLGRGGHGGYSSGGGWSGGGGSFGGGFSGGGGSFGGGGSSGSW